MGLPGVNVRPRLQDQLATLEAAKDAAQVPGIDAELSRQLGGGRGVSMCDLVEDADFRQRKRAVEVSLPQHADVLRVEAVESADGGDGCGEAWFRPGHSSSSETIRLLKSAISLLLSTLGSESQL